jgi:hypothetical protein
MEVVKRTRAAGWERDSYPVDEVDWELLEDEAG